MPPTVRLAAVLSIFLALIAAPARADDEITSALPVIPARTFNLTDFGGAGDWKTWNTDAFRAAIAAVAKAGGGRLVVPPGVYKTMPFELTSRLELVIEAGAVIKFPDSLADYGLPDPAVSAPPEGQHLPPLISGHNLEDVAITGSGTIDGSGAIFWPWSEREARRHPPGRTVLQRPHLVVLSGQRLRIAGVTLTCSPMFHLIPSGEDITIEDLRITAPRDAPNTDAIDPSGRRIVIRRCEIDVGDDNVALKGGGRDILIEDLTCWHGHGISIGSETHRGFRHVVVRRCRFQNTSNGLRIKSYRGKGGDVSDIRYSDIVMRGVRRPIDLNMRYNGNAGLLTDVGPREAAPGQTEAVPHFHDIHFSNITILGVPRAGRLIGLPEQNIRHVTFTNVKIQSTLGFVVQDARDITFEGVQIEHTKGERLVLDQATVNWNGTTLTGPRGGPPEALY